MKSTIAMTDSVAHQDPPAFSEAWDVNDDKKNYILGNTKTVTAHACIEDNGKVIGDTE